MARSCDALLAQAMTEVGLVKAGLDFTGSDAKQVIANYIPGPAVESLRLENSLAVHGQV